MDFRNEQRTQPQRAVPAQEPVVSSHVDRSNNMAKSKKDWFVVGSYIANNVLLLGIALLIASVAWLAYSTRPTLQAKYVESSKLQAVFLNNGQVYFGNIQTLNKDYLVMTNIFYLQNSTASTQDKNASTQVSLVKLGCELHMPYDSMVINTAQVTFWENVKDDGQVAKAASEFNKQNPNGQKCSTTTTTTNPVQGTTTAPKQ